MNRLMLLGFLLATATAQGSGTIQLGKPTVEQERITVPVILGGDLGGGVSAMDFHFRYNPEAVQPISVVAGSAAESANKRVMSNQRTPGEYSVVMMGFNQSACGPGEAIKIVLQRLKASDQKLGLSLTDPTMSSTDGRLIESQVLPADIEPAENGDADKGKTERTQRLPGTDTQKAAQPAAVRNEAVAGAPPALTGAPPNANAAENLDSALQSAEEARQGIESPGAAAAGVEGPGQETGIPGENSVNSASEKGGRTNIAGLAGGKLPQADLAPVGARNKTVELQSKPNAAELPAGTRGLTGITWFAMAGLVVFVLAAGLIWRRSRLLR